MMPGDSKQGALDFHVCSFSQVPHYQLKALHSKWGVYRKNEWWHCPSMLCSMHVHALIPSIPEGSYPVNGKPAA